MRYFGRKLDAPVYWHGDWSPTPVGVCWYCQTKIEADDDGFLVGGTEAMHRMCLLRAVLGPTADELPAPPPIRPRLRAVP